MDLEGTGVGGRELVVSNRMNPILGGIRPATWNENGVASTQGMEKSASRTSADFQEKERRHLEGQGHKASGADSQADRVLGLLLSQVEGLPGHGVWRKGGRDISGVLVAWCSTRVCFNRRLYLMACYSFLSLWPAIRTRAKLTQGC